MTVFQFTSANGLSSLTMDDCLSIPTTSDSTLAHFLCLYLPPFSEPPSSKYASTCEASF